MSDSAADRTEPAEDAVVVYADYVCPFCYLGKKSLEQYQETREEPLDVEWRPFDLRSGKRGPDGEIDHDADDGKDEAYYEQAKQNVRRLQEEYGVEMTVDLSRDVDAWNAHQAALWARRHADEAAARAFNDGVFDALWRDGRDVGDPDVLAEIAADAGLDPDAVREAIEDEELEAELEDRFESAAQAGVTGVPTFVHDGQAARGAVPPEQLERLVEG